MTDLSINTGRINTLSCTNVDGYTATVGTVQTDLIKTRNYGEKITLDFSRSQYSCVDVAQAPISDADFIAILRSKIKVLVDLDDPLYARALARMVVAGPENT